MDYAVAPFENAWPVNSGVLQTTGSMRFVSPGPNFHPGNYEDNEHIVVFPERSDFVVEEPIRVDMVDPGEYAKSNYREKPQLLPGQRLTSYLLQLDAFPEGKNPNRRRSVRGQITFANPIAGVITMNRLLKESEAIFGVPDVSYPTPRTIESRPEGDPTPRIRQPHTGGGSSDARCRVARESWPSRSGPGIDRIGRMIQMTRSILILFIAAPFASVASQPIHRILFSSMSTISALGNYSSRSRVVPDIDRVM